jgi:formylglycine-generating enzyme required for sulfatase activity
MGFSIWRRSLFVLVLLAASLLAAAPAAYAEKRVALVIGNGDYRKVAKLPNPARDASAIERMLRGAGFEAVAVERDLGRDAMRRALRDFSDKVREADIAVVFYAGHGIEVNGANYLIPVDAALERDIDVEDEAVPLDRVSQVLEQAKRLRLVILDACRDNPFVRSMRRTIGTRSIGRGLAKVEVLTTDTLIAFAAKAGSTAADGQGTNSPYTSALVRHLATPGLDVRLAFGRVRDEVLKTTSSRQEPFVYGSLGGAEIALVPAPAGAAPAVPPPVAVDVAAANKQATEEERIKRICDSVYDIQQITDPPVYRACLSAQIAANRHLPPGLSALRRPAPLSADEERTARPKEQFRECAECPVMVVVRAGSYMMGSTPAEITADNEKSGTPKGPDHATDHEGPRHEVTFMRPFAVGRFEVTFEEWDACVTGGGCTHSPHDGHMQGSGRAQTSWGRGRRPVINVSWDDITKQYLPWLSRKTERTYRLLTEAEWEYAARAGTKTRYAFGDSISTSQRGHYLKEGELGPSGVVVGSTVRVGLFGWNAFGLHDTHGNVSEWVQDCYHKSYHGAPSDGSAWTTGDCLFRVVRGDDWRGPAPLTYRSRSRTDERESSRGFRVGRTLER